MFVPGFIFSGEFGFNSLFDAFQTGMKAPADCWLV